MRHLISTAVLGLLLLVAPSARADFYRFQVQYSGSGQAALDPGSADDPVGTTLHDGDSFAWTIRATGDGAWHVVAGGDFFPLMAFGVDEQGERTGDFTLTLRLDGVDVFTLTELGAVNNYVHVGTNSITLATGLVFDEMHLDYLLTTAIESADLAADPGNLKSIGSTINGLVPIFGTPDRNAFYPGITYTSAVPEPGSLAILISGMAVVAGARRWSRGTSGTGAAGKPSVS